MTTYSQAHTIRRTLDHVTKTVDRLGFVVCSQNDWFELRTKKDGGDKALLPDTFLRLFSSLETLDAYLRGMEQALWFKQNGWRKGVKEVAA